MPADMDLNEKEEARLDAAWAKIAGEPNLADPDVAEEQRLLERQAAVDQAVRDASH